MKKRLILVMCSLLVIVAALFINNKEAEVYTNNDYERIQVADDNVVITNQEE